MKGPKYRGCTVNLPKYLFRKKRAFKVWVGMISRCGNWTFLSCLILLGPNCIPCVKENREVFPWKLLSVYWATEILKVDFSLKGGQRNCYGFKFNLSIFILFICRKLSLGTTDV